ncbi:MAG: right-handed parallel beta-helix repeat-containing protein [Planctomycetes bacterium]|nr:right-handed parallel beta-helix repeat-containing protein [Planctomycetota bacterium]
MSNYCKTIVSLLASLFIASISIANVPEGGVLFVDDDAGAGGDGLTWNTAYHFLQDALTTASQGGVSEIHVAQGTYKPDRNEANPKGTGDREATFSLVNSVSLMGGYAGIGADDPDAQDFELYETILSGDLLGDDKPDYINYDENSYHVVYGNDLVVDTLFEGLTVKAGHSNSEQAGLGGAGMYVTSGELLLSNCRFRDNFAWSGSGVNAGGGLLLIEGSLQVVLCDFTNNVGRNRGGGLALSNKTSASFTNCSFSDNWSARGSCLYIDNATVSIADSTFTNNFGNSIFNQGTLLLVNCTFVGNQINPDASRHGGALHNTGPNVLKTNATIIKCTFDSNLGHRGGAIYNFSADLKIIDCLFKHNIGTRGGAIAFYAGGDSISTTNSTFVYNSASNSGGAIYFASGLFSDIYNCILWDNVPDQIEVISSPPRVTFCDVQSGWKGTGNINDDPLFIDSVNDDYRLSPGSPCIDAGHNWRVPIDSNDYDADGRTCELFPVDLDGNPRFNADENDFDTGCGAPVVVDMGAYEYQFDPVEQIKIADISGDGVVGTLDLLSLLAEWGLCEKGCCIADFNDDGFVVTSDLLFLLANWGPCE